LRERSDSLTTKGITRELSGSFSVWAAAVQQAVEPSSREELVILR
jgi:hypothetical protein